MIIVGGVRETWSVSPYLLHLTTPVAWRAALACGVVSPPSLDEAGFVHLSTPEQVALPANRLYAGRTDLVLLVLDPARLGVEVRYEPGVPTDPASQRFPHAYGPVPVGAVLGVLPYRPRTDGGFDPPVVPAMDAAGRAATLEPSLLRRAASSEVPVTGGVAVLTASVPQSHQHNQLLIDGLVDATAVVAEADRVLGGAGIGHRMALLGGAHLAPTAAGLVDFGWHIEELVGMAAPTGGARNGRVEQVERAALRPLWDAMWRRDIPGVSDSAVAQLADRYDAEAAVIDLRHLAVRDGSEVVAGCLLKIDGATAQLDAVGTDPAHRGRGHADALVAHARALAGEAGCDLVVLEADAADWPHRWYARRGFTEVTRSHSATRLP